MIRIKAKRIFKTNNEFVIFEIKINGNCLHTKFKKDSLIGVPEKYIKSYIANEIYGNIEIDII